ncbi:hypothetical protein ACVIW2_000563 [Bradyrhizobium huanghuaihaiense]|uniref:Uncharacterized protein n=2 Tax=Bradyrhizobium huanghuaihaiense TaxID=990078 RepID=A0A562RY04_9BRAD|nr:hypothetical protein IQ16_01672 [Bradyrhizobium huanghuaihaiense]
MFKPRYMVSIVLLALSMIWPVGLAQAQQAFQRFLPFLVDLNGWEGRKPEGMSMQMAETSVTTATRDYERGEAQAHATIILGPAAEGALAPIQSGMNVQTADGHMITGSARGMQVFKTFHVKDKSGMLIVALSKEAVFSFTYQGVGEDEALALADRFDWKEIQAVAQKK